VSTARVGPNAGTVQRKSSLRRVNMEKDSNVVRVEAVIDAALTCSPVVALDEQRLLDGNKSGLSRR
jgi:hypothetical protein